MSVTLKDVAAKAGVTKIVVSRVLHNRASTVRVSEATAERVREAAKELGYRCNVSARNFRNQQTNTIGILHGAGFPRPTFNGGTRYSAALMDGIIEGAFRYGYSVTLCPQLMGDRPDSAMGDGRFDGFVWYINNPSEANRALLRDCQQPLVFIHSKPGEFGIAKPTVICDNHQGMGLAIEHLHALGHQRIAFAFEPHWANSEVQARLEAFHEHKSRLGLSSGEDDLVQVDESSVRIDEFLLARSHTALICAADSLAGDFLARARVCGVTIPHDLSVIGWDSTSYCQELQPQLTSVCQPLSEMGEAAIRLLVATIAGELENTDGAVLPCILDVRESTIQAP